MITIKRRQTDPHRYFLIQLTIEDFLKAVFTLIGGRNVQPNENTILSDKLHIFQLSISQLVKKFSG
jgi:hypothetical protein